MDQVPSTVSDPKPPIRRLDLGGTACYVDPSGNSVSISLDGSTSDDDVTPRIIGDYFRSPFPNQTFDEAFGSCVLECDPDDLDQLVRELLRIMKPGGRVIVKGCNAPETYHWLVFRRYHFICVEWYSSYKESDGSESYDSPYVWEVPQRRRTAHGTPPETLYI